MQLPEQIDQSMISYCKVAAVLRSKRLGRLASQPLPRLREPKLVCLSHSVAQRGHRAAAWLDSPSCTHAR
jgi:hypothetical protein